ncbi:STN domain-containing protein [Dyella tabacisoli]|nr:STN domain-containing protein [Dyella tabacisoli]
MLSGQLHAEQTFQPQYSTVAVREGQAELTRFDIEPQTLMTALRTYSEATGLAVLVDDRLTSGRQSPGVKGAYTVNDALQRLLDGTGLTARYASDHAFTLAPTGSKLPNINQQDARPVTDAVEHGYLGLIQKAIERALCRSELARSGDYRLAMQLWIDSTGEVGQIHLLDSTGSDPRDAEIRKQMDHLMIGTPPPALPQPLTLLLLPGRALTCFSSAAAGP